MKCANLSHNNNKPVQQVTHRLPGRAACLDAPGHLLMAMDLLEGGDLRSALDEDAEGALRWYRR